MMSKSRFLKGILIILFTFNVLSIRAQQHTASNQIRGVQQQNLDTPKAFTGKEDMLIRISEIEIEPNFLDEYNAILKEEAEASVRLEPGVIAIFPMFQKDAITQIRIIEIYANEDAYQSHLQTPHFKYYKTETLNMVKSLKLVDMESLDPETMSTIFQKMN